MAYKELVTNVQYSWELCHSAMLIFALDDLQHAALHWEHGIAVLRAAIAACRDASSVMWNRMYSKEAMTPYDRFCVCRQLKATLEATGAQHMVIGHTPQVHHSIQA